MPGRGQTIFNGKEVKQVCYREVNILPNNERRYFCSADALPFEGYNDFVKLNFSLLRINLGRQQQRGPYTKYKQWSKKYLSL